MVHNSPIKSSEEKYGNLTPGRDLINLLIVPVSNAWLGLHYTKSNVQIWVQISGGVSYTPLV